MPQQQQPKQQPPVRSRAGTIAVITTECGLPTALKLDRSELARPPQELANEILALCKLSALRAQVAFRRDLAGKGYTSSTLRQMGLPAEEELTRAEAELFGEDDEDPPATWMRSV